MAMSPSNKQDANHIDEANSKIDQNTNSERNFSLREDSRIEETERVDNSPLVSDARIPQHLPSPIIMRAISPQKPLPAEYRSGSTSPPYNTTLPSTHFRSPSPRHHSPASSSIFERNVQESTMTDDFHGVIPAHIRTEDHVPAVLEASSIAITDGLLKPDDVEIVMHAAHQSAAISLTSRSGYGSGHISPFEERLPSPGFPSCMDASTGALSVMEVDSGSTYGSIDPTDVKRLSFISFADVIHSEHAETAHQRDSILYTALSNSFHASSPEQSRHSQSPSPTAFRSPSSLYGGFSYAAQGQPSPPVSGTPSLQGMDALSRKLRQLPASPTSLSTNSPPFGPFAMIGGGELMVETMAQAMKRTESGDLMVMAGV